MEKQTERYDDALSFLASVINRHEVELNELTEKINVYRKMEDILERKAHGEKIPNEDYDYLVKLSCPSKAFLLIFDNDLPATPDGFLLPDDDLLYFDCPAHSTCIECWKDYLTDLSDSISKSSMCIKLPPKGKK